MCEPQPAVAPTMVLMTEVTPEVSVTNEDIHGGLRAVSEQVHGHRRTRRGEPMDGQPGCAGGWQESIG